MLCRAVRRCRSQCAEGRDIGGRRFAARRPARIASLLFPPPPAAAGGGWTRPPGHSAVWWHASWAGGHPSLNRAASDVPCRCAAGEGAAPFRLRGPTAQHGRAESPTSARPGRGGSGRLSGRAGTAVAGEPDPRPPRPELRERFAARLATLANVQDASTDAERDHAPHVAPTRSEQDHGPDAGWSGCPAPPLCHPCARLFGGGAGSHASCRGCACRAVLTAPAGTSHG